jgi:phosphonate transport system substrate-binding protein
MRIKYFTTLLLIVLTLSTTFFGCAVSGTNALGFNLTDLKERWGLDKLVIVLMPGEDDESIVETRDIFDKALSEKLMGLPVEEYRATDYSAMTEAMKTGFAHVGQFGPFAYTYAVDRAGAEALVVSGTDGTHGYYSYLITHVDSGITSLDDLKGRSFGFVDPESASGNIVPSNEILNYFQESMPELTFDDLHINGNFFSAAAFTGSHANSVQGVFHRDIDAAGVSSTTLNNQIKNGLVEADKIKIIHTSPLIPSSPYAIQKDLPQELKDLIKQFFLDWDDEDFWDARTPGARFIEANDKDYDYTRELRDKFDLKD